MNQWHHLALTIYGGQVTIYVDTKQYAQINWTLKTTPDSTLYIGGLPSDQIQSLGKKAVKATNFIGRIQDIKV